MPFVLIQACNLLQQLVGDATTEVSFDGGKSFRPLTGAERINGIEVEAEQRFTVRVSKPHHQSVVQPLLVTAQQPPGTAPAPPDLPALVRLDFDGPRDFGSVSASSKDGIGASLTFEYMACLTVFRDGDGPRAAAKNRPIDSNFMFLLAFQGARVLDNGSGLGRFNAVVSPILFAPTPAQGKLFFALAPDDSVPQLVAVFVPTTVDLQQPVPLHVFFCPSTGGKEDHPSYPFGTARDAADFSNSFDGVWAGYLAGFTKRLLHQQILANKQCVLVFPLPPPNGYYDGIQDAERLRSYCLELVFFAQRTVGNVLFPKPQLGRCALSGFSEAGKPINNVIQTSLKGGFPELKEIYCFDVVSPAGNTQDAASYQKLFDGLTAWMRKDADRRVRIYTQSPAMSAATAPFVKGATLGTGVGGAVEQGTANSTFAFLPAAFWAQVNQEHQGVQPDPIYLLSPSAFAVLHQMFPCIFLEHALQSSGFS